MIDECVDIQQGILDSDGQMERKGLLMDGVCIDRSNNVRGKVRN